MISFPHFLQNLHNVIILKFSIQCANIPGSVQITQAHNPESHVYGVIQEINVTKWKIIHNIKFQLYEKEIPYYIT